MQWNPMQYKGKKENRMREPSATTESQRLSEKKQHREHCVCFTNVAYVEKGRGGGAPSICLYKHNAI